METPAHRLPSAYPLRCHVTDALFIDKEAEKIIDGYMQRAFSQASPTLKAAVQPELRALLRGLQWCLAGSESQTPGQSLQNLRITHSGAADAFESTGPALPLRPLSQPPDMLPKWARLASFGLTVLLPWLCSRLLRAPVSASSRSLWRLFQRIEAVGSAAEVFCRLFFIADGRYPTLLMLILRMQFVYRRPAAPARPEFDFMNQELAWRAFANFLVNIRPFWPAGLVSSMQDLLAQPPTVRSKRLAGAAPSRKGCALCESPVVHTPYVASCGHIFCYYCLASACVRGARARCPHCVKQLVIQSRCNAA